LTAKRACEISGAALLEQHDTDQKETNNHVDCDNEVEKNLHGRVLSLKTCAS
jgi:hypothetical protein